MRNSVPFFLTAISNIEIVNSGNTNFVDICTNITYVLWKCNGYSTNIWTK